MCASQSLPQAHGPARSLSFARHSTSCDAARQWVAADISATGDGITETAPVLDRVPDFAALLRSGEDGPMSDALRKAESTGDPWAQAPSSTASKRSRAAIHGAANRGRNRRLIICTVTGMGGTPSAVRLSPGGAAAVRPRRARSSGRQRSPRVRDCSRPLS